jgi:hypothetical protein
MFPRVKRASLFGQGNDDALVPTKVVNAVNVGAANFYRSSKVPAPISLLINKVDTGAT